MKPRITLPAFLLISLVAFKAGAQVLTPADFEKRIADTNIQLLDVRTADEYKNGHIPHSLQADWNNREQFKTRVLHLDTSKPVYVYCAAGSRSKSAAQWLRSNNYSQVYELTGGFIKWKEDGKLIEGMPNIPPMSAEALQAEVSNAGIVLVDIGAAWCPPCRKMNEVLQSLQQRMTGKYKLLKIDAGINTKLMTELKATELPTLILFKKGKEVWRKAGIVELKELEEQINSQSQDPGVKE